jgi:adenine-specific DNA-methyltransferase
VLGEGRWCRGRADRAPETQACLHSGVGGGDYSDRVTMAPDTAELRKARGAFFTPPLVCRFIAEWAIRNGAERILEPSCGEAEFLVAAASRLDQLRAEDSGQLAGVELHDHSAREATRRVAATGRRATIATANFFAITPAPVFDVVIGNPPYVRFQDFNGAGRALSRRAAALAGVELSALASSWAAFTVQSALSLRTGGRLGLVLPAELLAVNYAAPVRRFLSERFGKVRLVLFRERVFPGVQEDVVLLLADGYGEGQDATFEINHVENADDLARSARGGHGWVPVSPAGRWNNALVQPDALKAYTEASASFTELESWGDTTLGMVTGNNSFFTLSPNDARLRGLKRRELLPISPAGSRHLRGVTFSARDRAALGRKGERTLLFRPPVEPSGAALAYILEGQASRTDQAYKCRVRTPWWRVPLVKPADMLLTYMNADTPRLCQNLGLVHHLNSVHGVYLRPELRDVGARLLPLASLSSVTMLGAELVGRSYGGGMLKLEPKEADRLPVPSMETLLKAEADLEGARRTIRSLTRAGRLFEASAVVDDIVLHTHMSLSRGTVSAIRSQYLELLARRRARSKGE